MRNIKEYDAQVITLEVFNIIGERVLTELMPNRHAPFEVDLSKLSIGIYLVRIQSADNTGEGKTVYSGKVVIQ